MKPITKSVVRKLFKMKWRVFAISMVVSLAMAMFVMGLYSAVIFDHSMDTFIEETRFPDVFISLSEPVDYSVADGVVTIQDARLVSTGEGGTIRYAGAIGEAMAQEEGSALLFDALRNFTYDRLEVLINGPLSGEISVAVTLEGKNPVVLDGHPMKLQVNIEEPLAEIIRRGTIGYRFSEQLRRRLSEDDD